ncbi:MAG: tetratricopeptide repeat protein [Acidobacteriota bacterium]
MRICKLIFTGLLAVALLPVAYAQNGAAQRSPLDATNWGVVLDTPATKLVKVKTDVPYLKDANGTLTVDIYLPPDINANEKRAAVLFINAVGDRPNSRVKNWEIYKSWPRLVAAHGLVGVSMDADGSRIQECLRGVFEFLTKQGEAHGIDGTRLGLYAASANVTGATQYLNSDVATKNIRAAALYYGGVPNGNLRSDLPVLFIVAAGDAPRLGQPLTALWQRVVETGAPWTLMFAQGLPHAFDAFSDNDDARRIIQQTLGFWKSHLEPVPQPTWARSQAREIVAATYDNNPQRAASLLADYIKENPSDATAQLQYGRALQQLRRFDEAIIALEKALTLDPTTTFAYSTLGQIKIAQQKYQQAAQYLTRAIDAGQRNSLIYGQLAWAQLHSGRNEEAVKNYEKAFEMGIPPGANTRGVAFYNLACGYARLGQKEKALTALASAMSEGFTDRKAYETDEDLVPLRAEPRFQELLSRLPKS